MRQQGSNRVAACSKNRLTVTPLDDQKGENNLESESPCNGAPADGASIGGKNVGKPEEDSES